jgi:sialic acid synthase SpsE
MNWLRQFCKKVGWSDHSLVAKHGIKLAKVAIRLGANYVERHFTILDAADTKDGPVSITPDLLKQLSGFRDLSRDEQCEVVERDIPEWRVMLGIAARKMTTVELLNRDYYRGRFASPHPSKGGWLYNWEEHPGLTPCPNP